jgi:hypothetical protein
MRHASPDLGFDSQVQSENARLSFSDCGNQDHSGLPLPRGHLTGAPVPGTEWDQVIPGVREAGRLHGGDTEGILVSFNGRPPVRPPGRVADHAR